MKHEQQQQQQHHEQAIRNPYQLHVHPMHLGMLEQYQRLLQQSNRGDSDWTFHSTSINTESNPDLQRQRRFLLTLWLVLTYQCLLEEKGEEVDDKRNECPNHERSMDDGIPRLPDVVYWLERLQEEFKEFKEEASSMPSLNVSIQMLLHSNKRN
jgi:hypothetical protein